MTENENVPEPQRIWCRRLEQNLPIAEHSDCPYCFGRQQQIAGGEHTEFCAGPPKAE